MMRKSYEDGKRLSTQQPGAMPGVTLPRIGRVAKAEIYSIKSGKGSTWQRFKKSLRETSNRKHPILGLPISYIVMLPLQNPTANGLQTSPLCPPHKDGSPLQ